MMPVSYFVYLDDMVMVGDRWFVPLAVRKARCRRQTADCVIRMKSQSDPHSVFFLVLFLGKIFDLTNKVLKSRRGMLRVLLQMWFLLVMKLVSRKEWRACWVNWSGL